MRRTILFAPKEYEKAAFVTRIAQKFYTGKCEMYYFGHTKNLSSEIDEIDKNFRIQNSKNPDLRHRSIS
jgi:hypothetical protein